jgi:hypothetical protein
MVSFSSAAFCRIWGKVALFMVSFAVDSVILTGQRGDRESPRQDSIANRHRCHRNQRIEWFTNIIGNISIFHAIPQQGGVRFRLLSGSVKGEQFGAIVVIVCRCEDGVCFDHGLVCGVDSGIVARIRGDRESPRQDHQIAGDPFP